MGIGAYEPFWISSNGRRLYAALHAAPGASPGQPAVLMVPPLLHEQHRSHRFLCELASSLCARGITCLRFSFFGTGDSEGDGAESDFVSMARDIDAAARSLRERSSGAGLVVLAFRSACLPLGRWLGNAQDPPLVAIVWDPVLDGRAWLRALDASDAEKLRTITLDTPALAETETLQLMGLPISESLRSALVDARWSTGGHAIPVWAVMHEGGTAPAAGFARIFHLPGGMAEFQPSVLMDALLLFTPPMENLARQLSSAMSADTR